MKKLLKNKRIIAFVLAFTISFMSISFYGEKQTKAIAIVDDMLFWTLGTLVLASGVVAVSDLQVKDMGKTVYDNFKLKGYSDSDLMEDIINTTHTVVKIGSALKNVIDEVSSNLKTSDVFEYKPLPYVNGEFTLTTNTHPPMSGGFTIENFYNSTYKMGSFKAKAIDPSRSFGLIFGGRTEYPGVENYVVGSTSVNGYNQIFLFGVDDLGKVIYFYSQIDGSSVRIMPGENCVFTNVNESITIPYSNPVIKRGYNPTFTNDNLPYTDEKQGYIPIPTAIPTDIPINTETPLDWNKVKDNVQSIPVDSPIETPADDVLDIPNEGSVDIPTEQTGLWGWLSSLLRAIFNVLKAILNAILGLVQGILNGILDILTGLLSALIDAISSLFVPTVSISELFVPPAGSGFSALLDLFNWDSVFNIEPKPYKFKTDMLMKDLTNNDNDRNWNIEINLFDNSVVKNNINLIRNVLSYSLLISVIYFIVYHFLPKRDMD